MEKDYVIVGQGLAGSILAFELLSRGKSIVVIDEGRTSSASKVAAGLYNPIVFKRLTKSWMVDDLLAAAKLLYAKMEAELGVTLHFDRQIVKLFSSEEEKNFWFKKAQEPNLALYLDDVPATDIPDGIINHPFGAANVKNAGNIQPLQLLAASRDYLCRQEAYREEKFDTGLIEFTSGAVRWKEISAKKIIFCEGHEAIHNPYFSWLPFVLTKGETLTLKMKNYPLSKVVNKGVFILPLGADLYKVGATYNWSDLSDSITEKGKQELVEKLNQVLSIPYEIVDHQAGIRPTVKDRRPLLGVHPKHPELAVFNGMGTKAALIAPYFSSRMADFLDGKTMLSAEVDIARFSKDLAE